MPSKDYKDALNDIRLSSDFCAKMEAKLAEEPFEDDEYEEVENHVEVIETKGFKGFRKYIAAAAVVAVLGAVGSGGYMRIRNDFGSDEQYGVESEIEEESSESENTEKIFDFPFGSIDISGLNFIFHQSNYMATNNIIISSDETADQLIDLFSKVDWTETRMGYSTLKPDDDDDEADELIVNINTELGSDLISFNYYKNGFNCHVTFTSGGSITVSTDTVDTVYSHISYYEMEPEQFKELKQILFSEQNEVYVEFAGIKTNIVGSEFSMLGTSGTVNEEQAQLLSKCFNRNDWYLDTDCYEKPIESPITLYLSDEKGDYRVDLYSIGLAFVSKLSSENGEVSQKNYRFASFYYDDIQKILKGEKDIECPINISYMEDAIMQVSSNGKCGGYTVDKDDLSRLQKVLKESHWKSELYTNIIFSYGTGLNLYLKDDNSVLYLSSNGTVIYYNRFANEEIYGIDRNDLKKLEEEVNAICAEKTKLTDTELAQRNIDDCLSGDTVELAANISYYSDTGKNVEIPTEVLREVFEGTEWKLFGADSDTEDQDLNTLSSTMTFNVKYRIINTDSADNILMFNDKGVLLTPMMFSFKSSDSQRIAEQLEQLYDEYKK